MGCELNRQLRSPARACDRSIAGVCNEEIMTSMWPNNQYSNIGRRGDIADIRCTYYHWGWFSHTV